MDHSNEIKLLFQLIEQLRDFKKLNKKELALLADITPQYYSELLEGKKTPSIGVVMSLLHVLDAELKPIFKQKL